MIYIISPNKPLWGFLNLFFDSLFFSPSFFFFLLNFLWDNFFPHFFVLLSHHRYTHYRYNYFINDHLLLSILNSLWSFINVNYDRLCTRKIKIGPIFFFAVGFFFSPIFFSQPNFWLINCVSFCISRIDRRQ